MPRIFRLLHSSPAAALVFAGCSSSSSKPPPPYPDGQVRAVHASPDAGPVDIYLYSRSARPSAPAVSDATYPQITGYLSLPAAQYTVDVLPHGALPSSKAVASEQVAVNASTEYSVVVGGKVGSGTLQFINFVEPAEVVGQTALIVHHASPYVQSAIAPVGVGVYDAGAANGGPPASTTEVFAFGLKNPSGPATSGTQPADGEYVLSPLPSTLPAAIGFAAGALSAPGNPLLSIAVYATAPQLAIPLANKTAAQSALAADSTSAVPAGAHVSIFAIDTETAAQLVGTLDP